MQIYPSFSKENITFPSLCWLLLLVGNLVFSNNTLGQNTKIIGDYISEEEIEKTKDAKTKKGNGGHAFLFPIGLSVHSPGGDLQNRFGNFGGLNAGFFYRTASNWMFGTDFTYFFGTQVNINPLQVLEISPGQLLGEDGLPGGYDIGFRGFVFPTLKVGYQFVMPLGSNANEHSGLSVVGGIGFIGHWIRYNDINRTIPIIQNNTIRGYDRYTSGLNLSQSIGYNYFHKNKTINFGLHFDFSQGITQNRRFNFDTQSFENNQRLDLMYGLRLTWWLPVYGKREGEFFYY